MKTSVRPAGCVSSWLPDTTDKYGGIQTTTRASPTDAEFTTFSGSKRMSALELTKRMFSGLRSVCVSWLSCRTGHTHIHIEREREKEKERERVKNDSVLAAHISPDVQQLVSATSTHSLLLLWTTTTGITTCIWKPSLWNLLQRRRIEACKGVDFLPHDCLAPGPYPPPPHWPLLPMIMDLTIARP